MTDEEGTLRIPFRMYGFGGVRAAPSSARDNGAAYPQTGHRKG
jgi:hypothetical protein